MPRPSTASAWRPAGAATLLLLLLACPAGNGAGTLDETDRAAIRAVDAEYVRAWLAGDSAAVLATLTDDAVLLPGGGRPVIGREAARSYWWPADGSRTTITSYTAAIDEIGGTPAVAYARGHAALEFVYERDTVRTTGSSRTMVLMVLEKQPDGSWRIARRMWAPLAGD